MNPWKQNPDPFFSSKSQFLEVICDLANWPGLSPVIAEIEVDGVDLQISVADGKISLPPMRLSERFVAPNRKPDVSKLTDLRQ